MWLLTFLCALNNLIGSEVTSHGLFNGSTLTSKSYLLDAFRSTLARWVAFERAGVATIQLH